MKGAAETIKRVTLELGGKSANVVFADADLEAAAGAAPYAVFGNAGQDCCARSRILVEQSAYDRFLELLVDATKGVNVGDPESDETEMGPLVSADQREAVSSYVDGNVAYQGNTPEGTGFWFPPTIRRPASNDDRAAREEIFGPVAGVIPFADEADAIRLANDTPYGLSGSIWTRDVRPRAAGRAGDRRRACSPSTRILPCASRRRSAASSSPASAESSGCTPWTATPRSRTSTWQRTPDGAARRQGRRDHRRRRRHGPGRGDPLLGGGCEGLRRRHRRRARRGASLPS